ncbi:hypothetical protein [Thiohalomonas denitrificans]|uniref:hypothetical protein n=1 Tax=Thiohalomonas denitrificans TaxID=415747 RepID=UPI0011142F7B|nr:hypothetical protein [Thiohalomonas denitrificans]
MRSKALSLKAVEEVLHNIVAVEGTENTEIVVDVRTENASGFSESVVRTIKESSRGFGFEVSEFQEVEW